MKLHVVSTILLLGACGGSDLDPGSGNDTGSGTQTLVVEGSASAEARITNARTGADFDTEFRVRVSLNGQDVTTGTVQITSASGTVDLVFTTTDNEARWRGSAPGYDEVYILDVISGEDAVEGVRVDGPDIHVFEEPVAGATVDATLPLDVIWDRGDEAASASIDTDEIDRLAIVDSGEHELPAGTLKTEQDKAQENTIRITRENTVVPAGAIGGSQWAVSIRNEIEVLAAPAP
jgi:hypothetical protein